MSETTFGEGSGAPKLEPEALRSAKRSVKLLQLHAGHRRAVTEAQAKIATDVRTRLAKHAVQAHPDEPWPALAAGAAVISRLPASLRGRVLASLPEQIREDVVERLCSFGSVPHHGERALQKLIAAVNRRTLATALVGAEAAVHDAIVRNMSKRAAAMLEEDVQSLIQAGEISTRDVRDARDAVGRAFYALYESGEIER